MPGAESAFHYGKAFVTRAPRSGSASTEER